MNLVTFHGTFKDSVIPFITLDEVTLKMLKNYIESQVGDLYAFREPDEEGLFSELLSGDLYIFQHYRIQEVNSI